MKRLLIKIIPKWLKNSAVKDYLFIKFIIDQFAKWQPPFPSDKEYGILTNLIFNLLWLLKGIILLGFYGLLFGFNILLIGIPTIFPLIYITNYFGNKLGFIIWVIGIFLISYLLEKLFKTKSNKSKK